MQQGCGVDGSEQVREVKQEEKFDTRMRSSRSTLPNGERVSTRVLRWWRPRECFQKESRKTDVLQAQFNAKRLQPFRLAHDELPSFSGP